MSIGLFCFEIEAERDVRKQIAPPPHLQRLLAPLTLLQPHASVILNYLLLHNFTLGFLQNPWV